ncbi:hypothetical protein D3C72_1569640 [compost metagenome]
MRVAHFTEPLESVFGRRDRTGGDERPMNPQRREEFARRGIFAEPVVIFPFGEIVNGTLLQVEAMLDSSGGAATRRNRAQSEDDDVG